MWSPGHLPLLQVLFPPRTGLACNVCACREMRCLRHKIHIGLFCAFGLSALNWIVTKSLPELAGYLFSVFDQVYCTSWVITFFFHLTCFYWMFLEGRIYCCKYLVLIIVSPGLYLFLQVQFPLSLVSIKYKHFIMFGCGETDILIIMTTLLTLFCYTRCPSDQHGGVDRTQDLHLRSKHHQGYHQELSFL